MTTSFEELSDNYSCILFDAFGVLKNSQGVYAGVMERLGALKRRGKEIFVVTNDASKSPAAMAKAYTDDAGNNIISARRIITSGLLATDFLMHKVRSGWVAYLGKESSAYYIELAGLSPVPISELDSTHSPRALALLDDEGYDWFRDINAAVNLIRHHNLPVVVANTDLSYPADAERIGIAVGGVADLMENVLQKRFIRFGKPDPMVFSYAFQQAQTKLPNLTKRDVLMVGDTLTTDIAGANKFGIDTALVLSGTTLAADYDMMIQTSGVVPNYVCESILT